MMNCFLMAKNISQTENALIMISRKNSLKGNEIVTPTAESSPSEVGSRKYPSMNSVYLNNNPKFLELKQRLENYYIDNQRIRPLLHPKKTENWKKTVYRSLQELLYECVYTSPQKLQETFLVSVYDWYYSQIKNEYKFQKLPDLASKEGLRSPTSHLCERKDLLNRAETHKIPKPYFDNLIKHNKASSEHFQQEQWISHRMKLKEQLKLNIFERNQTQPRKERLKEKYRKYIGKENIKSEQTEESASDRITDTKSVGRDSLNEFIKRQSIGNTNNGLAEVIQTKKTFAKKNLHYSVQNLKYGLLMPEDFPQESPQNYRIILPGSKLLSNPFLTRH